MGNAMLIKAGGGSSGGSGGSGLDQIFVHNGVYICNKTGNYRITCVGGGGGGSRGNGVSWSDVNNIGFSGYNGSISSKVCLLNEGEKYEIIIGLGGAGYGTIASNGCALNSSLSPSSHNGFTGGTTSFSTIVSAVGGQYGPVLEWNYMWNSSDPYTFSHVNCSYQQDNYIWVEIGTIDDYIYTDDGYNFSHVQDSTHIYKSNYGYGGGGAGIRFRTTSTSGNLKLSLSNMIYNTNNIHRGGDGCVTVKYID